MIEIPVAVSSMMHKYGDKFKEIFDAEINWFAGKLCFIGIPSFDIVKFNGFMRKRGYNENDSSLADYIEKNYGKKGKELVDELLNLEVQNG